MNVTSYLGNTTENFFKVSSLKIGHNYSFTVQARCLYIGQLCGEPATLLYNEVGSGESLSPQIHSDPPQFHLVFSQIMKLTGPNCHGQVCGFFFLICPFPSGQMLIIWKASLWLASCFKALSRRNQAFLRECLNFCLRNMKKGFKIWINDL